MVKLSIAITTYNHEKYIDECLDSIFKQEAGIDFEILISDDHSQDNTASLIKGWVEKHDTVIKYIERDSNIGYVKNLYDLIERSNGKYISIFDGDDRMLPEKLIKQIEFLDNHSHIVMVGHHAKAFNSDTGKTIKILKPKEIKTFYSFEDFAIGGSFFANSTKMFRKDALDMKKLNYDLKWIADWQLSLEIALEGEIGYLYEVLSEYRVHEKSMMQQMKGDEHYEDMRDIMNSLNKRFPGKYDRLFKDQWAYAHMIYGIDLLQKGLNKKARHEFIESIRSSSFYNASQYYYLAKSLFPGKK